MSADAKLAPSYTPTFTNNSEYKVLDEKQLRFLFDNWEALLRQPCLQPADQNSDGIPFYNEMKDMFDIAIVLPEADIGRTNFIARNGPANEKEMIELFRDRIFTSDRNDTADAIIRLGEPPEDFFDIENKEVRYISSSGKRYRINYCLPIKDHWPKHGKPLFYNNQVSVILENGDSCPCCFCCDIEEETSLSVVTFPIKDGTSICIDSEEAQKQFTNLIFKLILSVSEQKKVVIHCKAGVGRTGHLIYTILFIQKLGQLVVPGNLEATAKNFRTLLDDIRYYRFGAVFTHDQFLAALNNAALALRCHYRKQLDVSVEMAEIPRAMGGVAPRLIAPAQSTSQAQSTSVQGENEVKREVKLGNYSKS